MARSGKAAICRELNKPVVVETVSVDSPKRGEVMVKLAACGVCHSDLSATNGTIALPPPQRQRPAFSAPNASGGTRDMAGTLFCRRSHGPLLGAGRRA